MRETIKELEFVGLLNDRDFAVYWARSRFLKGYSQTVINDELKLKGVEKPVRDSVLSKLSKEINADSLFEEIMAKRIKRYKKDGVLKTERCGISRSSKRTFTLTVLMLDLWEFITILARRDLLLKGKNCLSDI